jgi:glycine/serine hydroxymethyltransferase
MDAIASAVARILEAPEDETVRAEVRGRVRELCEGFPLVA